MKNKSNLDEMQEQKLRAIEASGYWLTFWGLLAAIVIQAALGSGMKQIIGELVVFAGISLYLMTGCIRHGIWDRKLKPDLKTNLLGSLVAAVFIGVFTWFRVSANGGTRRQILAAVSISSVVVFLGCLGTLSLTAKLYENRRKKLDKED